MMCLLPGVLNSPKVDHHQHLQCWCYEDVMFGVLHIISCVWVAKNMPMCTGSDVGLPYI
jgi:hypothetical protein